MFGLEVVFDATAVPITVTKQLATPTTFPYLNSLTRNDFNASDSTKTVRSNMDSIIKFRQFVRHKLQTKYCLFWAARWGLGRFRNLNTKILVLRYE